MKSRLRRLLPLVAACAMLSSCGGDEAKINVADGAEIAKSDAAGGRVVIHMTGLVMIVPPKTGQNGTRVLLTPLDTIHKARVGFGMDSGSAHAATLCVDTATVRRDGICYVDLNTWTLEPFGSGGTAVPSGLELPRGVLHATRFTGGLHTIPNSTPNIPQVVLLAGWAGPTPCSLANWTYEPRDARGRLLPPETRALINVLDWEIEGLSQPTLVFEHRTSGAKDTVPLVKSANGTVELILANIPKDDYKGLPPGQATSLGPLPDSATHVHAYYNVLRDPNQRPANRSRRPMPREPKPITTRPCPVAITRGRTASGAEGFLVQGAAAIATYACIVGTGD